MHFINHLGNRGVDFLHPGGKKSTEFLVNEIIKNNPKSILELGCGTGATLVSLAAYNINQLIGIDVSNSQISMANKRLKYCGLENFIQLFVTEESGQINFSDNSFDVVFAESVLGVLEHDTLIKMILETKRVLKPNGIFLTNDAIWGPLTSLDTIKSINNRAMKDFGLVQSSEKLIGKDDWETFFKSFGFKSCKVFEINSLKKNENTKLSQLEQKSNDFTSKQKRYSLLNPIQLFKEFIYRIKLKLFHQNDGVYLESYVFILQA